MPRLVVAAPPFFFPFTGAFVVLSLHFCGEVALMAYVILAAGLGDAMTSYINGWIGRRRSGLRACVCVCVCGVRSLRARLRKGRNSLHRHRHKQNVEDHKKKRKNKREIKRKRTK